MVEGETVSLKIPQILHSFDLLVLLISILSETPILL